jgi:alpha-beta hydrolase superfamily lysophospholipase
VTAGPASGTRSARRGIVAWLGRVIGATLAGYLGYLSLVGSRRLVRPGRRPFEPMEGWPATPAEIGLAYEDVRFTTDDGITLSGWLLPSSRDTRSAVILLHGFYGNRLPDLVAFASWLQPHYHVLQFDFRGHGHSGDAAISLGAHERRDVAAAVRFMESRGFGPLALMGISMGASVAIVAAPDLPVAAVVADAPFAELWHPVATTMRRERYPLATLGARLIVASAAVRARARPVQPLQRVSRIAPRGLLIIAPRGDALISYTQSEKLYARAGEPKELYVVDGAEHATACLVGGDTYRQRVLAFLARHLEGAEDAAVEAGRTGRGMYNPGQPATAAAASPES